MCFPVPRDWLLAPATSSLEYAFHVTEPQRWTTLRHIAHRHQSRPRQNDSRTQAGIPVRSRTQACREQLALPILYLVFDLDCVRTPLWILTTGLDY
ncbi:hypothetical protein AAFF_G00364050, partial [Aldrovandia affinis]